MDLSRLCKLIPHCYPDAYILSPVFQWSGFETKSKISFFMSGYFQLHRRTCAVLTAHTHTLHLFQWARGQEQNKNCVGVHQTHLQTALFRAQCIIQDSQTLWKLLLPSDQKWWCATQDAFWQKMRHQISRTEENRKYSKYYPQYDHVHENRPNQTDND